MWWFRLQLSAKESVYRLIRLQFSVLIICVCSFWFSDDYLFFSYIKGSLLCPLYSFWQWVYEVSETLYNELNRSFSISPSDSRFTQQELPACKPILTPRWVSFLLFCIFITLVWFCHHKWEKKPSHEISLPLCRWFQHSC